MIKIVAICLSASSSFEVVSSVVNKGLVSALGCLFGVHKELCVATAARADILVCASVALCPPTCKDVLRTLSYFANFRNPGSEDIFIHFQQVV